jgi:hypothetical protein
MIKSSSLNKRVGRFFFLGALVSMLVGENISFSFLLMELQNACYAIGNRPETTVEAPSHPSSFFVIKNSCYEI